MLVKREKAFLQDRLEIFSFFSPILEELNPRRIVYFHTQSFSELYLIFKVSANCLNVCINSSFS